MFAHPGGGEAAASVREFEDRIDVKVNIASRVLDFVQTTEPMMGFIAATVSLTLAGVSVLLGRGRNRRVAPW